MNVVPKEQRKKSNAYLVMKQIQAIYREEGKLQELPPDERLMQRQLVIKPLVDALFVYLKKMEPIFGGTRYCACTKPWLQNESVLMVYCMIYIKNIQLTIKIIKGRFIAEYNCKNNI